MTRCRQTTEETSVMIVEDEARLRDILVSSTKACGFRSQTARSAEEAIEQMQCDPCDLMMLDLNLPCMDGLRCFEIVRQRWPETAVVILTGFGNLEAAQRAIRLGVIEFLTKPASLGDIEQALHRAWRARFDVRKGQDYEDALSAAEQDLDSDPSHSDSPKTIRDIERECIIASLNRHEGNREAAAAELGISVRTLYYRLANYQGDGFKK